MLDIPEGDPGPTKRKRVLFLIPSLAGGGAERVFTHLLRHVDRRFFEPHLAVLERSDDFTEDIPEDVVVHDLKVSRVRYALPSVVRLAWQLRPDTILSTHGHLNVALLAGKALFPRDTKLVVRETVIVTAFLTAEIKHATLWTWLYRRFYPRADALVCLSDSIADDMANHFNVPREKLVRIYNPVDVDRVRQEAALGGSPFSGPGPHLVAAGRLTQQKGFDLLIEAMPRVLAQLPDATLTILGKGELQDALRDRVQTRGLQEKVTFIHFQKNPWLYFKHAHLFVLPSRYEGMPNVILEALALNTPVVAADCPGAVREMQRLDDRVVLVPPEDPKALADAIVAASRNPRCGEGDERIRLRMRPFDVRSVVDEYSRVL